jgi:hypothetical protein
MAITSIGVVGPRPERQEQQEVKKDPLDDILKGLQIANGAFGLAVDYQQFNSLKENRARLAKEEANAAGGILNPMQELTTRQSGTEEVEAGSPGAVGFARDDGSKFSLAAGPTAAQKESSDLAKLTFHQKAEQIEKAATAAAIKLSRDTQLSKNKVEEGLRKEYRTASKDTITISSAFERVKASAKVRNATGGEDIALVNGVMRIWDPGVSVREGDVRLLRSATSVPEWIRGIAMNAVEGRKLTDLQRQELFMGAATAYKGQLLSQQHTDSRFTELAATSEVDAPDIIEKRYANELASFDEIDAIAAGMVSGPVRDAAKPNPQRDLIDSFVRERQERDSRESLGGGR